MLAAFTERGKRVVELALEEAGRRHDTVVGTAHLLIALIKEGSGIGAGILNGLDVSPAVICERAGAILESPQALEESRHAAGLRETIALAREEARKLSHAYVGTEHILLAIVGQESGDGARSLVDAGVKLQDVHDLVLLMVEGKTHTRPSARSESQACKSEEKTMVYHQSPPTPDQGPGDLFGPGAVDQTVRQAVSMCWMLLPPEKKSVAAVEREIRRIVERALANLKEDGKSFGIPDNEG